MKVLLVEDCPADAWMTSRILASPPLSAEVIEVGSGAAALEAIASQSFDCVVLDYLLPDMDGVELMRRCAAVQANVLVLPPIIVLTSNGQIRIAVDALREGASDYLNKNESMEPELLTAAVNRAIRERELERQVRRSNDQMRYFASCDPLTTIGNRRAFEEALQQSLSAARRGGGDFALLLIDLNKFKAVNDAQGHLAGDRVLQDVAASLAQTCRAGDLVFRIGGDEFAVLLALGDEGDAAKFIARRISKKFTDTVSARCKVGASVGVATYPVDGETIEALYSAADRAMYAQKNALNGQSQLSQ